MVFGIVAALISAFTFPVLFFVYGQLATVFVNWTMVHKLNLTETINSQWYVFYW
jgi:hypothetical protein